MLAIAFLVLAAYAMRGVGREAASRRAAPWWLVGVAAMVFGFPWYLLMRPIFGVRSELPFCVWMLGGVVWAAIAYVVLRYLSLAQGWTEMHRWAVVFGATLVCMIAGFAGSSAWPRIDVVGKWILDVGAVIGFLLLAYRVRRGEEEIV